MATLHWIIDSNHCIMEKKCEHEQHSTVSIDTTESTMKYTDTYEKETNGGMDTEATSESDATARYDYTGIYRLSTLFNESSLEPSMISLLGGYIALRPIMGQGTDEYNIAVAIHEKSQKIMTARLSVSPCMDYVSTCLDQEESPYDDIIGLDDLKWMTKPQQATVDTEETETAAVCTKAELEEQERIEAAFAYILTKCDMIRFVGEYLVLEGPKGAIECVME